MRIRSIKPELWTDLRSGDWDARTTLFFVGIWMVADDKGKLRLEPRLISAALDPYGAKFGGATGVAELLERLVSEGRVVPYEVAGERFGVVAHFKRHQVINKPSKSRLPEPPTGLLEPSGSPPEPSGSAQGTELGARSQEVEPGAGSQEPASQEGELEAEAPGRLADVDMVLELRAKASAALGRELSGCSGEKLDNLRRLLARHGVEHLVKAAREVDQLLRERGHGPLASLGGIPGFLLSDLSPAAPVPAAAMAGGTA